MNKIKLITIVFFVGAYSCTPLQLYGAGRWSRTGDVNIEKCGFSSVVLSDGKIMIIGGFNSPLPSDVRALSKFEIFDPATGEWKIGNAPDSTHHTMCMLLPNGEVIYVNREGMSWRYEVTGAWSPSGNFGDWMWRSCATLLKDGKLLAINYDIANSKKCALYDYTDNSVTSVGSTAFNHSSGDSTQIYLENNGAVEVMLGTGEVMIIGGTDTLTCEIYDPVGKSWTTGDNLNIGRSRHVGMLLPAPWNKVLVVGGANIPARTETWSYGGTWQYTTGNLNMIERATPIFILLPSGKPMIMGGGTDNILTGGVHKECELYDPDSGTWSFTDPMETQRGHLGGTILHTGKVIAISGQDSVWSDGFSGCYRQTKKCEIYDPSEAEWTSAISLASERAAHTATPLPIIHTSNCSTNVLIAGGEDSSDSALSSCELYNYIEGNSAFTGSLNIPRTHHTANLLPGDKVLVVGGKNTTALRSCELYNISTEIWTITGAMNGTRFDHAATVLMDSSVLVTGGQDSLGNYRSSCEIYKNGSWTLVSSMDTARARHTAVLMPDGKVLVIGGENSGGTLSSCEIWDGMSWSNVASLSISRSLHTAIVLQCGKVLVIGGKGNGNTALSSCELYNPATYTWFSETSLNTARWAHNSTLLYSGLILVTGGYNGSNYLNSCEIWDPGVLNPVSNRHEWKTTATLTTERGWHSSVLVPASQPYVLIFGGENASSCLNSVEQYDIGLGYRPEWQSTITNYPSIVSVSDSMEIKGTLFRGVSEADGGNHCHIASSDHPITAFVRIGGGNFQGNGGGEMLYIPQSSYWDTATTCVKFASAMPGEYYYRLWTIANGIPCKWYKGCMGIEENSEFRIQNSELQVYPNPFTQKTVIKLSSIQHPVSSIQIYDLSGRLVKTLFDSQLSTLNSQLSVVWDGTDNNNRKVQNGIYFVKLKAGDYIATNKLILVK